MISGYYPQLHSVRGLAAMAVLVFHWGALFNVHPQLHEYGGLFSGWWFISFFTGFGWVGVMFFFVLSGVVLAAPYTTDRPVSVGKFYLRRLLRIYPALWMQILIFVILGGIVLGMPEMPRDASFISNALLWLNLPPNYVSPVNGVWWTLPVELGFYLLFPLVIWCCRNLGYITLFCVSGLLCLGWRMGVFAWFQVESYAPYQGFLDAVPSSFFYFCVGVVIAHLRSSDHKYVSALILSICIAGLIGLLIYLAFILDFYWQGHFLLLVWPLVSGVLIGGIIYALKTPLGGAEGRTCAIGKLTGDLSYGIYLWHFPVLLVLHAYIWNESFSFFMNLGLLLATIFCTALLALLSYRFVEQPLIAWGKKIA